MVGIKANSLCVFAIVASSLVSCSLEEEIETSLTGDLNAIHVTTYIKPTTRATVKSTFVNGDILELYAYKTTGGGYDGSFSANYMDNVQIAKGEGGWTYSPLYPWPHSDKEFLSFVAFYPYSDKSSALTYPYVLQRDKAGYQVAPMSCTILNANSKDRNGTVMNGETDIDAPVVSGAVQLKFRHLLSRIKVNVKLDKSYLGVTAKINSLSLSKIYTSGTYQVAKNLLSGSWNATTLGNSAWETGKSETLTILNKDLALTASNTLLCDTLMIPQAVSSSVITLSYSQYYSSGEEKKFTKTINLSENWLPNTSYNYTIKLALETEKITIATEIETMENVDTPALVDRETPAKSIDLGLPSGTQWAEHDYGAATAYVVSPVYKFSDAVVSGSSGNLTPAQDRAKSWGSNWSTPTSSQWDELRDHCTVEEKTLNGTPGHLLTSTINGNTLFFSKSQYWISYYRGMPANRWKVSYYTISEDGSIYGDEVTSTATDSYMNFSLRPVYAPTP
jgi:hypothetical protein